jgi:hypothetical protein
MGTVIATIRVSSDDTIPVPVPDVLVRVYDNADTFLTEGATDALGEVDFLMAGDDPGINYILRLAKDGWGFPPAPTKGVIVTDPPAPDNEFDFVAHEGATASVVTISVADNQLVPQAVPGVRVWVYNDADQFITEGETDSAGEAEFILEGSPDPGTEYIVRLRKDGYEFSPGETAKITVLDPLVPPQTNTFDFTLTSHSLPESADPDMCRLTGYLTNASLHRMAKVTVEFHQRMSFNDQALGFPYPGDPSLVRRYVLVANVTAVTDENGYLDVSLPRGGLYDVHVHGMEHPATIVSPIVVPDAAGWRLEEVFFPYVQQVVYGSDLIGVTVEGSTEVDLTSTMSNGLVLGDGADVNRFLRFYSSDESVAVVEVTEDAKLRVTGIAVGTATVSVERVAGTWAPRRPALGDVLATPPTVEVT